VFGWKRRGFDEGFNYMRWNRIGRRNPPEDHRLNSNSRLFDAPGMRVVLSDGTRRGPAHAHPWATAKILIDGPDAHWRTDAGQTVLAPGEALLMNAFEMHESTDREPAPQRRLLIVMMAPELVESLAPAGAAAPSGERPFVSGKIAVTPPGRLAAGRLADMLADGAPAPEFAHAFAAVLVECHAVPAALRKGPALDFRLRQAIDRARAAPEHFSVDDMIAISGLARSRFFELFKASMGLPPQAYLDALLLFRAAEELPRGRTTVAQIGRDLGFEVADTFTRFLAREVGLTPRAYRKVAARLSD
jgi:AraC-like DNA-binding protein